MEKLVMFLNSLLVLMVPTQVTDATSHKSYDIDDLLCKSKPGNKLIYTTVTIVDVDSEEHFGKQGNTVYDTDSAASTNYTMTLVELTRTRSGLNLKEVEDYEVQVQWQRGNCTYRFSKENTCYVSGGANQQSTIEAIECKQGTSVKWMKLKERELNGYHDLINGNRVLTC